MSTRALGLAALLIGLLTTPGCGGGGGKAKPATATPTAAAKVPALSPAWTADVPRLWSSDPISTLPPAWTVGDVLVLPTRTAVRGIDAASGRTRWTVPVGRVCSIAPRPNADGVVAVLTGSHYGIGEGCRAIVTIDAATGKRTQRIPLTGLDGGADGYGLDQVAIGAGTVVASNTCDAAYAFALRTGRRTATLPGADAIGTGSCIEGFASDGGTTVGAARSDDRFTGYRAGTGRRTFTVPLRRIAGVATDAEIARLVATDPLIVDASVDGARALRLIDPDGRTQRAIGRGTSDSAPPTFTEVVGDRLVVQYAKTDRLTVLDRRDGSTERSVLLGTGELAVGVRDGQVLSIAPSSGNVAAAAVTYAIRATDPATGATTTLGDVRGGSGFEVATHIDTPFLAGDTLVVPGDGRLVGYRVPADGVPARPRTDPADDLCTAITPGTRRALGFLEPDAPAPAACDWAVRTRSDGLVIVDALASTFRADGATSAETAAHAATAKFAARDTANDRPALQPLSGLGDEAWAGRSTSSGFRRFAVVTRVGDTVVWVTASYDRAGRRPPPATARKAVQAAVAEMVAELARRR